jgi:hypothetical protein
MRLSQLPFVLAVVAVASTATAHSWQPASVIGTIDPATVSCDDRGCTATLRAERVQMQYDDFDRRDDAVKLTVPARAVLGGRGETWPDARSALLGLGGAPVRARGEFDWIDDHGALTVETLARLGQGTPDPRALTPVFPACGRPPWSQAALQSCFSIAGRERAVTVRATLGTDGNAPMGESSETAWLDLDDVHVDEMGIALAAPANHELATMRAVDRRVHSGASASPLRALRAGARLTLEGTYIVPAPASAKGIAGPLCSTDRCWPRLVIDSVRVSAAKK